VHSQRFGVAAARVALSHEEVWGITSENYMHYNSAFLVRIKQFPLNSDDIVSRFHEKVIGSKPLFALVPL